MAAEESAVVDDDDPWYTSDDWPPRPPDPAVDGRFWTGEGSDFFIFLPGNFMISTHASVLRHAWPWFERAWNEDRDVRGRTQIERDPPIAS